MKTNRFLYWAAQLGGWFSYGILISLATYTSNPDLFNIKLFYSVCVFLLFGIGLTHLMRISFIKWGFLDLKLAPLIPRILLFSMIGAVLMASMNHIVSTQIEGDTSRVFFSLKFLTEILALSLLFTLWNAIYFTYHFFRKTTNQELHVFQMQASQNEIELKSLRAQINPHFLFNSLNSIRALIDIEPRSAKESVTSLSNLLRKSLMHGRNSFIDLDDEIDLVKNYLDLEKIRFEERLQVEWQIEAGLEKYALPPFIIHSQVENAIKHGISKLIEGGVIRIHISRQKGKSLKIEISNTGKIDNTKPETGIGIENTLRRLDLQYKGRAKFELYEKQDQVYCTITIKD